MGSMSAVSLPKVRSRAQFIDQLEEMASQSLQDGNESSRGRPRDLKTYIIESNDGFPRQFKHGNLSYDLVDTDADTIKILRMKHASKILEFFLDISDKRFFTLHTNEKAKNANDAISSLTDDHNHTFDNTWFYSDLLKKFSQKPGNQFKGFGVSYTNNTFAPDPEDDFGIEDLRLNINGSLAEKVQKLIEEEPRVGRTIAYGLVRIRRGRSPDSIQDDVHNNGYFAVKRGKSVQDHLQLVDSCKDEYAKMIQNIENSRIGAKKCGSKTLITCDTFNFDFKNEIKDVEFFISKMFNSAKPFKLWGLKSKIDKDYYRVTAVDLHAGGTINFDITKDMMRVGIYNHTCGNTILRLFTNLQIHYDSKITCRQLCC